MSKKIKLNEQQLQRLNELRKMTPKEWEALCKNCGVCCLLKISYDFINPYKHSTLYMNYCCEHLNCNTRKCKIYENRIEAQKGFCRKVKIKYILSDKCLPSSSAYVEYVFGPAKYNSVVDFSKVVPLSENVFYDISYLDLINHIILNSDKWNIR